MRVAVPHPRALVALAATLAVAGCGAQSPSQPGSKPQSAAPKLKPRATAEGIVLTPDPEAKDSFPLPEGTRGATRAPLPGDAPAAQTRKVPKGDVGSDISPGAPSDAEIRRELKEMNQALKSLKRTRRSSGRLVRVRAGLTSGGHAQTPVE